LSAAHTDPSLATNPLTKRGGVPVYDAIRAEHVVPAMRAILTEVHGELETLEGSVEPTWSSVVEPLERMTDRMDSAWRSVGHLLAVRNSDALREAYEEVQGDVIAFGLRAQQSRPIFDALEALAKSTEFATLTGGQQRIVENLILQARHAGVALDGAERARFREIQQELAQLGTDFSNHVLDATKAFSMTLRDPAEMDGAPESLRQLAAQNARAAGETDAMPESGPWRITLDYPLYLPFLQNATRRDLREKLYRAFITRAGSGDTDNTAIVARTLELRGEVARLLGHGCYAEVSLASKMAPDVDAVAALLEELLAASHAAAVTDLEELREHARAQGATEADDLQHWDVPFWSARLREARFDYKSEDLRPYFPMPKVLDGLFRLAHRLFGVQIVAADGEAPVWHDDVRFFRVLDSDHNAIGAFYLDAYSRPGEKRGGAWMSESVCRSRRLATSGDSVRLPVAILVCNGTPPVGDRPSLMTFMEVNTLFHEFGHGLQHMLTTVDELLAAGTRNVEWDAVELPSQFMENFCYHRSTIDEISGHVDTGEPLPEELFRKLAAARTYRAGSDMLRQLYLAMTDLELHRSAAVADGSESAFAVQLRVAERTTLLMPIPEDRFLCSFAHIFAGGYSAGYYSYKWAEVLSADAFAAFEEAGLHDEDAVAEVGRRFRRTVLARGGSEAPMEVFKAFRGREPTSAALLRHAGLTV
jgi:oligopeptidase A